MRQCEQHWRKHPTKQQLYGHQPPIMKTILGRWTRHAGHCWRCRDELINDLLQWSPSDGRAKARQPARAYVQQLFEDTGCSPGDLPEEMNDREGWWERSGISVLMTQQDDEMVTEVKLDSILKKKKMKTESLQASAKYRLKYGKFDDILLQLSNAVNKQNSIKKWSKCYILPFSKKKKSTSESLNSTEE